MGVAPCNGVIFEENFDYFDMDTWEHEMTAGGGGVSIYLQNTCRVKFRAKTRTYLVTEMICSLAQINAGWCTASFLTRRLISNFVIRFE